MEETYRPLLERLEAMTPLPPEERLKLFPLLRRCSLTRGDYFVRAGKPAATVGFMTGGLLRYFYIDGRGREFTRFFCQGGSFVSSFSALVTGGPSPYSIQALETTELIVFTYRDWLRLLDQHPVWGLLHKHVQDYALLLAEKRERSLILDDAMTRYREFLRDYPGIEAKVKQYDIASYLGISPVTLSRLRGRTAPISARY